MGRSASKFTRQLSQVNPVALFERALPGLMLLNVMHTAKAHRPSIRRLDREPTVRVTPDVRTFDRALVAARYGTPMASYPSAMCGALARIAGAGAFPLKPFRKLQLRHRTIAFISR
jgi:hypothetical protein